MAFKDIIGQDRAVNILLKTIGRGRLPSSYLFAGESGIGKKLTAMTLAKALNCLSREQGAGDNESEVHGEGIDACDTCSSCKKIDSGIHPDVLLIAPESGQIRIEEIRAIDEMLSLKAFEGRHKVVVVDDADTMNQFAANAFLKTLEEPPGNSLIILITSNPDYLADTIRSRCSRINFTPLSLKACEEVIRKALVQQHGDKSRQKGKKSKGVREAKSPVIPESATLSLLVHLAMGRPGNVLAGDLLEERVWFMKLLKDMLNAEKDGWTSKEEMERWIDIALVLLRDMVAYKITRNGDCLINSDMQASVKELSSAMDIKGIIENYGKLNTLKGYMRFHLNKSLTWNYTAALLRQAMGDKRYA